MSKSIARLLLLAIGVLTTQRSSFAHDGGDDHDHLSPAINVRTWTITESQTIIEGAFVAVKDARVYIRQTDGLVRPVTIDRLAESDQSWLEERTREIAAINTQLEYVLTSQQAKRAAKSRNASSEPGLPLLQKSFEPFKSTVRTRSDADYFYVESNGIPDHQMMVGITAWQQQVPMPQKYIGNNAWQIPLHPVPAKEPMSAKDNFFRGAIAVAVNGIPIFNPIKMMGELTR